MNDYDEKQVANLSLLFHEILFLRNNLNLEQDFSELDKFSENEISVMNILGYNENTTLKEILYILKIPKSTLTGIINKLEKNDYIKRTIHQSDKRSYKLILTEKGKAISKIHENFDKTVSMKVLYSLDNFEERETFIELFGKVINNLKKQSKEKK